MTDFGTIGSILKSDNYDRFYWKVLNFNTPTEFSTGDFYWSPEVHHLENVWKLCVYPRGTNSIPSWMMLQVWRTNVRAVKPVRFSLGIYKSEISEEEIVHNERFDSDTCFSSGLFKFMRQRVLLEKWQELVYVGRLNIIFTIWIDEPVPVQVAGRKLNLAVPKVKELTTNSAEKENCAYNDEEGDDPALRQHLEDMLLTGDDHDVTLKVRDQQFRAHKCMLRVRSSVFAAMFKHEMKERADDSISIEDCDPESFGEFLQYLYTGKVKNVSLSNAMGLYYAGDKYDISGLKKICVEFLKASLSTTVIGDVISLAVKHSEDELLKCATEFFANHLEEIMVTVEWQRFLLANPIVANELCLKAVKTSYKKIK